MTEGGEVVFEGSYGPADRSTSTPVTPATRFGLASVTKMFTAVAIADLVTAGAVTLRDPGRGRAAAGSSAVHPAARRDPAPPALPHLRDRRLLRGGRGLTGVPRGLRLVVGAGPVVLDPAARRLPAALRRPAAVPPTGHAVPVLQRRLHRARPGHRGAHRAPVHRGRAGASLRPRRHDRERFPAPRRGTPGRRRRVPAAFGTRRAAGARTSTASRSSAAPTEAPSAPGATSTASCTCTPTAPCSASSATASSPRTPTPVTASSRATACTSTPTAATATAAATPASR